MKGVVLSWTNGRLMDVARDLPRQDARTAVFWLRETLPYFPPAVHLAVVDPGVGVDRRAVVLWVGDHVSVGPNNGVLRPPTRHVAAELDNDAFVEAHEVDVPSPGSTASHGWDVFAPAAADAHVTGASALGSVDHSEPIPIGSLSECRLSETAVPGDGREATGKVLVAGDFGNCVTNAPGTSVHDATGETVWVSGESVPVGRTFEVIVRGEKLVTVGNHGNVECGVNRGRSDEAFDLAPDDRVESRVD